MRAALLIVASLVALPQANASLVIATTDTAQVIDFSGFTGSGFAPSPGAGQLDSDTWAAFGLSDGDSDFGDTQTSGDFARGSSVGGETTGGVYAFDVGGNNTALGVQPAGSDFTPGNFTLSVTNGTGQTIDSWDVGYDVFTFNDQARANSLSFSFSTDGTNFTDVGSLDFISDEAADGSPSWASVNRATQLGVSIADGGSLFLRWTGDDVSGGGSRDEFALDNVSITANAGPTAIPEPSSLAFACGALLAGGGAALRRRLRQAEPTTDAAA